MDKFTALVACVALYVSLRVAWDTRFKPARIIAFFPSLASWKFNHTDGTSNDVLVVPNVVLTNIGAQPAVVEDVRMKFTAPDGATILARADMSVPHKAIDQPGEFFGDSSSANERSRLMIGRPFSGLVLLQGATASLNYNFTSSDAKHANLVGLVNIDLQVWLRDSKKWKTVSTEYFEFSENFYAPTEKKERKSTELLYARSKSRSDRQQKA